MSLKPRIFGKERKKEIGGEKGGGCTMNPSHLTLMSRRRRRRRQRVVRGDSNASQMELASFSFSGQARARSYTQNDLIWLHVHERLNTRNLEEKRLTGEGDSNNKERGGKERIWRESSAEMDGCGRMKRSGSVCVHSSTFIYSGRAARTRRSLT